MSNNESANGLRLNSRPPLQECIVALLVVAIPTFLWILSLDGLSLGWDSFNHHFYLGWMAIEGSRLQHDIFAAGSMSCQNPLSYGPLYWLQMQGASGQTAAMALAIPAIGAAPAIWLISWTLIPKDIKYAGLARILLTGLAFMSPLWWSLLDSTSNDISTSLPMIWSFALVIWTVACDLEKHKADEKSPLYQFSFAIFILSGALATFSISLKFSHIFSMLGLLVIAIASAPKISTIFQRIAALGIGIITISGAVWWPWAKQVWINCGSPIYPMFTDFLRPWTEFLP